MLRIKYLYPTRKIWLLPILFLLDQLVLQAIQRNVPLPEEASIVSSIWETQIDSGIECNTIPLFSPANPNNLRKEAI